MENSVKNWQRFAKKNTKNKSKMRKCWKMGENWTKAGEKIMLKIIDIGEKNHKKLAEK